MNYSPPVTRSMSKSNLCSECSGPLPWREQDPHAHPANGELCSACGRFSGFSAYGGVSEDSDDTLLMRYCVRRDWDSASRRLAYVPREADYVSSNQRNNTALWEAVQNQAPIELIQSLVDAYPGAVSVERGGFWCPLRRSFLYIPIENSTSYNLTEYFLGVCKILLEADNRDLQTVLLILSRSSSIWANITWCHISAVLRTAANRPASESMEDVLTYAEDGKVAPGQIDLAFRLLSLFVKSDRQVSLTEDLSVRLVHAVAGCPDRVLCLRSLWQLTLRFYPQQLTQPDENGDCPLHIAVSAAIRSDPPVCFVLAHDFFLDNKEVIETLLRVRPDAATFRDRKGNLPIHRALACGKTWTGGVKALVAASPGALNVRDSDKMIYPFMLAGLGDDRDISTSFELLRANPDVLANLRRNAQPANKPRKKRKKI